jgi:ABC-type branched-subunit amino acid transport system ATPase component
VISKLSIVQFKAIASATIPLGRITVLVGPNDSGKSTILEALMALSRCADPAGLSAEQVLECPTSVAATHGVPFVDIELAAEGFTGVIGLYRYLTKLSSRGNAFAAEAILLEDKPLLTTSGDRVTLVDGHQKNSAPWGGGVSELSRLIGRQVTVSLPLQLTFDAIGHELSASMLRLDPRAIARGTPLGAPVLSDGSGVVGIVDDLLTSGTGDEQIRRVNDVLQRLSPHVKSVGARRHPASGGKELQFVLRDGAVLPASQMSDGIVLAAALVLISIWSGSRRVLIEEPENGLHPRQLKVIVDTIRSIAETQGTQIVMTTHSPLLLNHFTAEEVVLVTRDHAGVHAQRMTEAKGLDDLASEMALGELWYNVGDSNLARPA